jgi:hypothetical protein
MINDLDPTPTSHVTWEEWGLAGESPYGDPEAALIERSERPYIETRAWREEQDRAPIREQIGQALGLLIPKDRLLIYLRHRGLTQEQTARVLGLSQPSVCTAEGRIIEWLTLVVPHRVALAAIPVPTFPVGSWDGTAITWDGVMRRHLPTAILATERGVPQSSIYGRWGYIQKWARAHSNPAIRDAVALAASDITQWCRPGTRAPNQANDR